MLGDGEFAGSNGLEHSTLAATVLTEKTVAAAKGQLKGGVGNEDSSVEDQTGAGNLDVLAGGDGG